MESPSVTREHQSSAESEADSIAKLLDLIPELATSYDLLRAVGHGTFSRVYLARIKTENRGNQMKAPERLALKHIIPTSHPSRVLMELKCLQKLGGVKNVVGVWDCHRHLNHIALAMPYFPHDAISDYMGCLTECELRNYLANLLAAVHHVHCNGVLHRDIKPANFLYQRATNRYCLVDFGLAQEIGVQSIKGEQLVNSSRPPRPPTPLPPTPHLQSSRPVKRKLPVDVTPAPPNKRPRCSPPSRVLGTCSASRLNSTLISSARGPSVRRSPRKCVTQQRSPSKENYSQVIPPSPLATATHKPCSPAIDAGPPVVPCSPAKAVTPRKNAARSSHLLWIRDSPSKHTRLAESTARKQPLENTSESGGDQPPVPRVAGPLPKLKNMRGQRASNTTSAGSPFNNATKTDNNTSSACGPPRKDINAVTPSNGVTTDAINSSASVRPVSLTRPSDTPTTGQQQLNDGSRRTSFVGGVTLNTRSNKSSGGSVSSTVCSCYGRGQVCRRCQSRPYQLAARAGTPGFRPPEVLLRHPNQGPGVDIWACGVVGLCVTSGRHPFFRAPDDTTALAELCTLFSTKAIRKAAAWLDKLFICGVDRTPLDLMKVCETLRLNSIEGGNTNDNNTIKPESVPCSKCLQPRVCLCPTDQSSANYIMNKATINSHHSNDGRNDLLKQERLQLTPDSKGCNKRDVSTNGGAAAAAVKPTDNSNSPTVNYLNNLTRNNCETRSPLRTGAVTTRAAAANSPVKAKRSLCAQVKMEPQCGLTKDEPRGGAGTGLSCGVQVTADPDDKADFITTIVDTSKEPIIKGSVSVGFATPKRVTSAATVLPAVGTPNSPAGRVRSLAGAVTCDAASPQWRKQRRPPLYSGQYSKSLYHLLGRLLDLNPVTRLSAEDALKHPFLQGARINTS